jgi:hypothetical protein
MVIAALLSFGILFVAWILAPGGPAVIGTAKIEAEESELEAFPVAA